MKRWVPVATYRIQLSARFGFEDARRILPYLERLGVDTLYLSPILAARRGSLHGYDGIDPRRIDPDRGGGPAFRRLARAAADRRMHLLVDIVPNHMAASLENPAWRDLLRHGPKSRFARFYDIDWDRSPAGRPAVVLPWLDRTFDRALRDGRVQLEVRGRTVGLRHGAEHLPGSPAAYRMLRGWSERDAEHRAAPKALLRRINAGATPSDRRHRADLLGKLPYRLVPWRQVDKVNYRRFFNISDLVGVRSDSADAFAYTHRTILALVAEGAISGIRVDHIDGLAEPWDYLHRLRRALDGSKRGGAEPYLVIEKILGSHERLPEDASIDGTTGYEVLARITGVLLRSGAEAEFDRAFRRCCGAKGASFEDVVRRAKLDVMRRLFPGDREELLRRFLGSRSAPEERASFDHALTALTAALGVYRTYARPGTVRPADRLAWHAAFLSAGRHVSGAGRTRGLRRLGAEWPGPAAFLERWQQWSGAVAAKGVEDTALYRYPRCLAANEVGGDPGRIGIPVEAFHRFMRTRARRWPVALTPTSTHDTKWGEDARARLVALAEYLGPWTDAIGRWRSGLSGLRPLRGRVPTARDDFRLFQAILASSPVTRPFSPRNLARLEAYALKSAREASLETSWNEPDENYERALREYLRALFGHDGAGFFRIEMTEWIRRIATVGSHYSLAQVVLRVTLPGVPDLYQGSEGWNHALVDPDNRRPVQFARLSRMLSTEHDRGGGADRWGGSNRPRAAREADKLVLTSRLLAFRKRHRALFERGTYQPLRVEAVTPSPSALAFHRSAGPDQLVVVVGRQIGEAMARAGHSALGASWTGQRVRVPAPNSGHWTDVLNGSRIVADQGGPGRTLPLDYLFRAWPFAILQSRAPNGRPHAPDVLPGALRERGAGRRCGATKGRGSPVR
jgi:(1->4)-alpha-D-glucan 1-alpha-D-glucosylmutase